LKVAVDGSGLFGFLVAPDSAENRREPQSPQGRAAAWVSNHLGHHEKNLMPYAILIAALIVLLWWRAPGRDAAVFAAVCGIGTFLAMAATRNAGSSIHHTVLVWLMPQLLVGAALGALPWRWLRVRAVALLAGANLLVINQYIAEFEQNGSNGSFTDATNPLADSLARTPTENIYVIELGNISTPRLFLAWQVAPARIVPPVYPSHARPGTTTRDRRHDRGPKRPVCGPHARPRSVPRSRRAPRGNRPFGPIRKNTNSDRGRSQRARYISSLPFPANAGRSSEGDGLGLRTPTALDAKRIQ